jgi:hypothetical protein
MGFLKNASLVPLASFALFGLQADSLGGANSLEFLNPPNNISVSPPLRSVKIKLSNNTVLRADVLLVDSGYEMMVLGGSFNQRTAQNLLNSNQYVAIVNGTFFGGGQSMGDIVGVSIDPAHKNFSKPFKSSDQRLERKIYNRYYVGLPKEGEWQIGRRSDLKDKSGKIIPPGADLSVEFEHYLGGLAFVDIKNQVIQKVLVDRSRKDFFVQAFNTWNRNYNCKAAYEGLDGGLERPRTGVLIGFDKQTNEKVLMTVSVGSGQSPNKGLTIFSFAKQCFYLTQKLNIIPDKLVFLDGGTSVSFANKSEGAQISSRPSPSALGIRRVSKNP